MDPLGHVGVALLVFAPVAYLLVVTDARRLPTGVAVVSAVALLPDVDLYVAEISHRGVTHTLWAALAVGVLLAAAVRLARPGGTTHDWRFVGAVGTLGTVSHLLGDMLTPMGIRPLAPLDPGSYTLAVTPAADPTANAALFVLGASVFAVAVALGGRRSTTPRRSWLGQSASNAKGGAVDAGDEPELQR